MRALRRNDDKRQVFDLFEITGQCGFLEEIQVAAPFSPPMQKHYQGPLLADTVIARQV